MTTGSETISPLFLAHGSPMLALTDIPAQRFLKELGGKIPAPKGIVVLSPHWETDGQRVSAPGPLKTIHDFYGFPKPLYDIDYPAEASAELVGQVMTLLRTAAIDASADTTWGLDHGAWVLLSLLYPKLTVPVVELSLPHGSTPESVHALGRSLAPLAEQGILLIGSGSTTHNLREIDREGAPAPSWAKSFDDWIDEGLRRGDISRFADLSQAPDFRRVHPTEEHLLPLFFAMGAAGRDVPAKLLHRSYSHGSISMSYFSFPAAEAA